MKLKSLLFLAFLISQAAIGQSTYDFGKGDISLKGSFLFINNFHLQFPNFKKDNAGLAGLAGGWIFHFNSRNFLEGSVGVMSGDFSLPDRDEGEYEQLFSAFSRLTFNRTNGVFSLGYGLNASLNGWLLRYNGTPPPNFEDQDECQVGFGPVLSGYYYLDIFYAGLQYHAQFVGGGDVYYSHIISLDLGLLLRVRKKSR